MDELGTDNPKGRKDQTLERGNGFSGMNPCENAIHDANRAGGGRNKASNVRHVANDTNLLIRRAIGEREGKRIQEDQTRE